jgi:hypothetical protein
MKSNHHSRSSLSFESRPFSAFFASDAFLYYVGFMHKAVLEYPSLFAFLALKERIFEKKKKN